MILRIIKITLLTGTAIILLLTTWFSIEFHLRPKSQPKSVFFEVEKGKGPKNIAQDLKEAGIIRKKWPFLLAYKLIYSHKSLKAGEYEFLLPLSSKDVLRTITEGRFYLHAITIPEGLTRKEIALHLESSHFIDVQEFLEASSEAERISNWDRNASDLEGYLYPETYHFLKGMTAEKIVEAMVSQFKKSFSDEMQRKAYDLGMSVREVVILASMIEKETSIPEERGRISSVFHNRLNRGIKLDCDPTIIYALKLEGRFKDRLRTKDLKYDTPYNTYLYPGLPPGPICNPGRNSIEAALYPAAEGYLYFVSKNDGSHHFSRTLKEHLRAVRKYQKR